MSYQELTTGGPGSDLIPDQMVQINLNDTPIMIRQSDLRQIISFAIPPYMVDSKLDAPDGASDLIRGAIKTAAGLTLNKLLFQVYGARAPKVPKRADKLPYVWAAITDFLIGKLTKYQVTVYVQANEDTGAYTVVGTAAFPLPEGTAGEVEGGQSVAAIAGPTES